MTEHQAAAPSSSPLALDVIAELQELLEDPDKLRRFVSFVNEPGRPDPSISFVVEREQPVPAPREVRP